MLKILFLSGNFMKNFPIWLIVFLFIGVWGYYFHFQNKLPLLSANQPAVVTPTINPNVSIYPSITVAPTVVSDNLDPESLKKFFAEKYNKNISDIQIDIDQKETPYLKGTVTFKLAMKGGLFLAVKDTNNWLVVFDGNESIPCKTISPYDFPKSMVSECINSNGKLVAL